MEMPDHSAEKELERLHDLIRTLSATLHSLSHDLCEPIRAVICFSELIRQHEACPSDPNLVEYLHVIEGSGRRMDALVTGMLEYSRLLGEGDNPAFVGVDMNTVVQTALANIQLRVDESGADVVADALPCVAGNFIQLTQLIQNLVGNGLKYRRAEPPRIFIRAEECGHEFLFSVEDNGIGVSRAHLETIFTPFKRLHGRNVAGVGLGLAICRQIVERHRGRIWVESTEGKGSTFRFTIPSAPPKPVPVND
jgi:signal transduction histidine kinase